jgi:signal transduction histidine kinase
LLAGTVAFCALYYALYALGFPQWTADAALMVPAGTTAVLFARRARRETGRARWFFLLLSLGALMWASAEALWVAAEFLGYSPHSPRRAERGFPLALDGLFLGCTMPMVAAMSVRPHPLRRGKDAVALVDVALLAIAICFVFLRLTFLPLLGHPSNWRSMQGALCFVLALWSASLWRLLPAGGWRRTYGALALFAVAYPSLANIAQGLGRLLPPGGPADIAWIVPFALLAAAAFAPRRAAARSGSGSALVLVACGIGPVAVDGALSLLLPAAGLDFPPEPGLVLALTALLTLGGALRLWVEGRQRHEAEQVGRARAEEERRGRRLAELAAAAAPLIPRIRSAVEEVVRRTQAASAALGDKADRALEQAARAHDLVGCLGAALQPQTGPRETVDLAALVESCVQDALEHGPALNVTLDGLGALPPVQAARDALAGCLVHLIRNAAQASPGGMLRISGDTDEREVVLRFVDDGPGVPRDHRHRLFDPFFTTRRVGEGFGLGLTEVHFVVREHGGTVLVEPTDGGACLTVRLPARSVSQEAEPPRWPLSTAVVASAAVALVLVLLPSPVARTAWSIWAQIISASLAAGALFWTAARHTARARAFWVALGASPALWSLTRLLRVIEGGPTGLDRGGVWHLIAFSVAELTWVVALLVRPDRPRLRTRSPVRLLGGAAAFLVCTYLNAYLILLPEPFGIWDAALRHQTALWRGAQRLGLAAWAFVLAARAATPYWRSLYLRLGLLAVAWGAGQAVAGVFRSRPEYGGGVLSDMGWTVPWLLLAGLALADALRAGPQEALPAPAGSPRSFWTALSLATVAALPAFDAFVGPSAHPDLDVARRGMTWVTVVVVGVLLAAREYLTQREPAVARRASSGDGLEPERTLKVVSTAVYEMTGHLSGITALARLMLTQSDVSGRARGDSERIQARADMAARIARNLITLLQGGSATPELCSLNRLVEEVVQLRAADLAHEGLQLSRTLDPALPAVWWLHAPAVRQALLCCLDAAAVGLRSEGRTGTIEISTGQEGDELLVRLRADGQGLPRSVVTPLVSLRVDPRHDPDLGLSLGREIVAQYGGTLTGRHRPQGGAELLIRLPMLAAPPNEMRPASDAAARTH